MLYITNRIFINRHCFLFFITKIFLLLAAWFFSYFTKHSFPSKKNQNTRNNYSQEILESILLQLDLLDCAVTAQLNPVFPYKLCIQQEKKKWCHHVTRPHVFFHCIFSIVVLFPFSLFFLFLFFIFYIPFQVYIMKRQSTVIWNKNAL